MSIAGLYPEHDKLMAVRDQSQAIGEFLEWLNSERGVLLATWGWRNEFGDVEDKNRMYPYQYSILKLLADYFEIDLDKIEKEKRQMIDAIREMNAQ